MCKMLHLFAILILLWCFSSFTAASAEIPSSIKGIIEKIESQKDELQGGAVAILSKGQVIYKITFGHRQGKVGSITSSTLFPLASVSKPVSAVAIALLVSQGTLNLNEKFQLTYLKHPVSLANILSHTTGYQFSGNTQIEQGLSRQKILEKLKDQQPQCKPGECYSYSNIAFSLVEEALNTKRCNLHSAIHTLQTALKTNSIQIVPLDPSLSVAFPHVKDERKKDFEAKPLPFPPYYPKAAPAAAGVFASLDGMIEVFKLSFGYKPHLISQATLDSLYTPCISNPDIDKWGMKWPCERDKIESYYGLGWRIVKAKQYPGKDFIFHSGCIAGIRSFIGFIPSEEMGIIILANQDTRFPFQTGIDFWEVFLK